jgi:hypothetical protein
MISGLSRKAGLSRFSILLDRGVKGIAIYVRYGEVEKLAMTD